MTARPMTDGLEERVRKMMIHDCDKTIPDQWCVETGACSCQLLLDLLSTSAAVRGMREALEEARRYLDAVVANSGDRKRRENYAGAVRRIDAVISKAEGLNEVGEQGTA